MKKHFFTLTEMLTVIAIISILAGIALPSLSYARQRARRTACINNQGQTMKIIATAMDKANNIFYSGGTKTDANDAEVAAGTQWATYLANKNIIHNLEALRCPALDYTTKDKELTSASLKEVYGAVFTTENDGKMDFRSSKLRTYGTGNNAQVVAANALLIGACTAGSDKRTAANLLFDNTTVKNKISSVHNNGSNIFFYDGHAEAVEKNSIEDYFYPAQTGKKDGKALKLSVSSHWLAI